MRHSQDLPRIPSSPISPRIDENPHPRKHPARTHKPLDTQVALLLMHHLLLISLSLTSTCAAFTRGVVTLCPSTSTSSNTVLCSVATGERIRKRDRVMNAFKGVVVRIRGNDKATTSDDPAVVSWYDQGGRLSPDTPDGFHWTLGVRRAKLEQAPSKPPPQPATSWFENPAYQGARPSSFDLAEAAFAQAVASSAVAQMSVDEALAYT